MDSATAYERNAREFLRYRDESLIGYKVVRQWANSLKEGAEVIEVACGGGLPITKELVEAGLKLWAIDSSKTMVSEFRKRFPSVQVKCERFQDSRFFERNFDAAISVGLVFLLPEHEQSQFLQRISNILKPGARFLFTAPTQVGVWEDLNTGIESVSLGYRKYEELLGKYGLKIISTFVDAGENNYYETEKSA